MNQETLFYLLSTNPKQALRNWNSLFDFKLSLLECDKTDLIELLEVFENHELYEHCSVINNVIKQKYENS